MSINKIKSFIKKDCHFNGLGKFLKINSTCSINLWNRSFAALETREPLSLLTPIESNFDSNLFTLSRVVLPTVKYQGIFAHLHINDFNGRFNGFNDGFLLFGTRAL